MRSSFFASITSDTIFTNYSIMIRFPHETFRAKFSFRCGRLLNHFSYLWATYYDWITFLWNTWFRIWIHFYGHWLLNWSFFWFWWLYYFHFWYRFFWNFNNNFWFFDHRWWRWWFGWRHPSWSFISFNGYIGKNIASWNIIMMVVIAKDCFSKFAVG